MVEAIFHLEPIKDFLDGIMEVKIPTLLNSLIASQTMELKIEMMFQRLKRLMLRF